MTKREIVFLCCRLMAIYLFMSSIFLLSQSLSTFPLFSSISMTGTPTKSLIINFNSRPTTNLELVILVLYYLAPIILECIGAVALWVLAREFAIRLFDNAPEELTQGPPLTLGGETRAVAFACMGLFFLAQDVPNLGLYVLSRGWEFMRWNLPSAPFGGYFAWEWLVRLPIDLWLIFGLRGIGGLWRLAQEKGATPRVRKNRPANKNS